MYIEYVQREKQKVAPLCFAPVDGRIVSSKASKQGNRLVGSWT